MSCVNLNFGFIRAFRALLALPGDPSEHHHRIAREPGDFGERNSPNAVCDAKSTPVGHSFKNPGTMIRTIAQVRPDPNRRQAGRRRPPALPGRSGFLGRQAYKEFRWCHTPSDGRKFTELYNVQHLKSNRLDPGTPVCISTILRLYFDDPG